jgi:hypothetical protein
MTKAFQGTLIALLATALCAAAMAQGATRDLRQIKVVSVDGNTVVVWDQFGAQEYTVPEGFTFTVDGKEVSAADLKAGMQGSTDVSKGVTVKPVHITEIKMGTVVSQVGRSVTVKDEAGQIHRFTQGEADERGVRFYMDDKPTRISELQPGDELAATVVSEQPPEILTAGDVTASIEGADAATASAAAPAAAPAEPSASAEEAATAAESTAPDQGRLWLWILAVILIAAVLWLVMRNKSKPKVTK